MTQTERALRSGPPAPPEGLDPDCALSRVTTTVWLVQCRRKMRVEYAALAARYQEVSAAPALVSPATLRFVSVVLLVATFALSFVFSMSRSGSKQLALGTISSLLAGFGTVAAFCAVGVHV